MSSGFLRCALPFLFSQICAICVGQSELPPINQPPPQTSEFTEVPRVSESEQDFSLLRFPSAIQTSTVENNTVEAEILLPRERTGPIPIVILLHYWGASDLGVEHRLAKELNRRGIGAAVLTLPYHLRRSPRGVQSGSLALRADTRHVRETITQTVYDIRRLIDWLQSNSKVDPARIGIAGISLGAVVGSTAYALDPRLSNGALLLGGGDIAHLIWNSSVTIETRSQFRRNGYTEEKLRTELSSVEPLKYATPDRGQNLLMVRAKFDEVIPPEDTDKLIGAFQCRDVITIDTGHYGSAVVERRLHRIVADYFQAKFFNSTFEAPDSIRVPTIRVGASYTIDYGVTVAAGVDIWRSRGGGKQVISALLTPQGPLLFGGHTVAKGLMAGIAITTRRITVGILWSVVL